MASSQIQESAGAVFFEYTLDNLIYMTNEAKNLSICFESPEYKSSNYSIDCVKRGKLLHWLFDTLNYFAHDCPNPIECEYRCSAKCQDECGVRCSELCSKPRILSAKTRQLTMLVVDIFLSKKKIKASELQLLATSALYLIMKFEETIAFTIYDALLVGGDIYSAEELMRMEVEILKTLEWKLNLPTAGEIARGLLSSFGLSNEINLEMFAKQVDDYIEFCLMEMEISCYNLAIIAITSMLCAFENTGLLPLGEKLAMIACQQLSLEPFHVRSCVSLLTNKILEYSMISEKKQRNQCNVDEELAINDRNNGLNGQSVPFNQKEQIEASSFINNQEANTISMNSLICNGQMEIVDPFPQKLSTQHSDSELTDPLECNSPCENLIADQDFKDQSMRINYTISNIIDEEDHSESSFNQAFCQ